MREVSVYGAGFSGLVTAWALNREGFSVEVVDPNLDVGGVLKSKSIQSVLVEEAANGVLNNVEFETLCQDIGLEIIPSQKGAKRRYIFTNRPQRWPLSVLQTLRLAWGMLRFRFFKEAQPRPFETVAAWGARVFSKRIVNRVIEPALSGIYAAPAESLSASLIFSNLFSVKHRPRVRGTVSFAGGMGEFVQRLYHVLQTRGVHFSKVRSLQGRVVVATDIKNASGVLRAEGFGAFADRIASVPRLSLTSVTVKSARSSVNGFGCLFIRKKDQAGLGVLQNNLIFAGRVPVGVASETWIFDSGSLSDEELHEEISVLRSRLGNATSFEILAIHRHKDWLPVYGMELEEVAPEIQKIETNLALVGNYVSGLGLAKILKRALRVAEVWRNEV